MTAIAIAQAMCSTCVQAALEGYKQAQIAGLCQKGAREVAADVMCILSLKTVRQAMTKNQLPPRGPSFA